MSKSCHRLMTIARRWGKGPRLCDGPKLWSYAAACHTLAPAESQTERNHRLTAQLKGFDKQAISQPQLQRIHHF